MKEDDDMIDLMMKPELETSAVRDQVTAGIASWLAGFAPDMVPRRSNPEVEDASSPGWMRRFVRDLLTTNPVTRSPLAPVQVYLIEQALACADWPALAQDHRLRRLDWSRASLVHPRTDRAEVLSGSDGAIREEHFLEG
jgi:hypothetical protein